MISRRRLSQLAVLVGSLALIIIFEIVFVRSSESYSCLRYDTSTTRKFVPLYDLRTGLQWTGTQGTTGHAQQKSYYVPPIERRLPSPNGKYVARLTTDSVTQPIYALDMIDPAHNELYAYPVLSIEGDGVDQFAWTPDNMEIYTGVNGSLYLAKTNPQTGEKHVVHYQGDWYPNPPVLSPDGKYLAQLHLQNSANNPPPPIQVSVISTSTLLGESLDQPLQFNLPQTIQPEGAWIRWASDSQHFAVLRRVDQMWHGFAYSSVSIDILGLDGSTFAHQIAVPLLPLASHDVLVPARWSADGHSLLFYSEPLQGFPTRLMAYHTDSQTTDVIADDLAHRPYFSFENMPFYAYDNPQQEQILLVQRTRGGQLDVNMINTNGVDRVTLIHDADSVGQPLWLPDGHVAAISWTQGKGDNRHGYLTLAHAQDKVEPQTLDFGYQEITGVQWLMPYAEYSKQLIFVGRSDKNVAANMLDIRTGKRQLLADGFAEIYQLHQDPGTGAINFWWRKPDGTSGTDGYRWDGQRVYRFSAVDVDINGGEVYQSPDGRTALLALNHHTGTTYELSWKNATAAHVLLSGAAMPDDVTWTPDGKTVAFAYQPYQGQQNPANPYGSADAYTIEVFIADGSDRHLLKTSQNWAGSGLAFSRCEELVVEPVGWRGIVPRNANVYRP